MKKTFLLIVAGLFGFGGFFLGGVVGGCGGGGDETTNALSGAYPADLAVTSLTANSSGSAGLMAGLKSQESPEEVAPPTYAERREEMQGILNAENPADLASRMEFDFSKGLPDVTGCFGPNIYLNQSGGTGHPNGLIFEFEPPQPTPTANNSRELPPKDVGIYEEVEEGQACIAVQMNKLIAQIDNYLRVALEGTAFTLAAGNLGGESLPAQGESRDLLNDVTDVVEAAGEDAPPIDFESATLRREAEDTGDGNPVYVTEMAGTVETGPEPPPALKLQEEEGTTATVETRLNHIPTAEDNSTYAGRLVQRISMVTEDEMNPNLVDCDGMTECLSIAYEKDSATELVYHMRRAQFCNQDVDCFDDNGDVTRDTTVWRSEYYYVTCSVNPVDGRGSCYQAWQAGRNDGNTRVFNVFVNPEGVEGIGRGYFGYGPAIDASEGVGTISGMICNWTGPGAGPFGNKVMVARAQQQNFALHPTSGLYESVGAAILYAPQDDCNKAANGYAFGNEDLPTDHPVEEAFTNTLIDLVTVDFTAPGLPVVPATP